MTDTVRIGGREFRIGAVYAPAKGRRGAVRREFLGVDQKDGWQHVSVRLIGARRTHERMSEAAWLRWAGDEVEP